MTVEQQPDTTNTEDTVRLACRPTREDIAEVMRVRRRVTPSGRRSRIIGAVGLVLWAVALVLFAVNGQLLDSAVPLLIVVVALCALTLGLRRLAARQVHKLRTSRGEHTITVGSDGVRVATDLNTMRVPWSQLSGYVETENLFALLHTGMNDINTTPLPKAALTQPADIDRLRDVLDLHTSRVGSASRA